MSDGYELEELTRIEDALDALVSPTSEDVFQATRPFDERAIASVAAQRAGGGGSMPFRWVEATIAHDTTADKSGSGFRQYQRLAALADGEILYDIQAFVNVAFAGSDADSVIVFAGIYDDYFDDPTSGTIDVARTYINYPEVTKGPMYGHLPTDFHHEALDGYGNYNGGPSDDRRWNAMNAMLVKRTDVVDPAETCYFAVELAWAGTAPTAGEIYFRVLIATAL